jgi:hypothetical protein
LTPATSTPTALSEPVCEVMGKTKHDLVFRVKRVDVDERNVVPVFATQHGRLHDNNNNNIQCRLIKKENKKAET